MGIFLAAMIVPFTTIEVARFSIVNNLGLYNALWAPILIYVGADLMQIFVYKQFIDKIPESLDESAMLDGVSYFTIFIRIIIPLVIPERLLSRLSSLWKSAMTCIFRIFIFHRISLGH